MTHLEEWEILDLLTALVDKSLVLYTEHDNLRVALQWCVENGEAEAGLKMVGALWRFWYVRGHLREGRERLVELLNMPGAEACTKARADVLNAAGALTHRQGDHVAARAFYEESLTMQRELGCKVGITDCLESMAEWAQAEGQSERAARLWGAAESLREAIGEPLPPVDRADHERNVAAARAALGEEGFAAAWVEGRKMTVEQAVE
jgi:hypothetical protein